MAETLREAVESGDRRRILEYLALELVGAIEAGPDPKDLAALSLRLEKVSAELEDLGGSKPGEVISWEERLAARRAGKASNA